MPVAILLLQSCILINATCVALHTNSMQLRYFNHLFIFIPLWFAEIDGVLSVMQTRASVKGFLHLSRMFKERN